MAKPILVIYYCPEMFCMTENSSSTVIQININLQNKFDDYHVIACPSMKAMEGEAEPIELKVFHEKDITELEIGELREMILKELEKTHSEVTK